MVFEHFHRGLGRQKPVVTTDKVVGQSTLEGGARAPCIYARRSADHPFWKFCFRDKYWKIVWFQLMTTFAKYKKRVDRATRHQEWTRNQEMTSYAIQIEIVAKAMGAQFIPEGIQQLHRDLCEFTRKSAPARRFQHQDFDWGEAQRRQQEPMEDDPWTDPIFYIYFYDFITKVDVYQDSRFERHLEEHTRRRNPLFTPLMTMVRQVDNGELSVMDGFEDIFAELVLQQRRPQL